MTRHTGSSASASSSAKKFDVFEFNEEDAHVEKASRRMLSKYTNPTTPITKYSFLQFFSRASTTVSTDLDAQVSSDSHQQPKRLPQKLSLEVDPGVGNGATYANSSSINTALRDAPDKHIPHFVENDFDLKNQSLDMLSDDEDSSSQISSSSTSTLNPLEVEVPVEDQLVEQGSVAFEINGINKTVDVFPDFVQYEDLYSTRSRLIFSCSSLKLEVSTISGTQGTFKIEWATEDIIKIESSWLGKASRC